MNRGKRQEIVLIGVLKNRRDLNLLLNKGWYRIPLLHAPRRRADYIAFYQPSAFGKSGQCVRYYARIRDLDIVKRKWILPEESDHPRADDEYYLVSLREIQKLPAPIINRNRMRISFGFTTLKKLLHAKTMMELFDIPPIEEILSKALLRKGLRFSREYIFSLHNRKKYRLDFVIFCKSGPLNIECDGEKWHSRLAQRKKDKLRDSILKKEGWHILRLKESDITGNLKRCVDRIEAKIGRLGGQLQE